MKVLKGVVDVLEQQTELSMAHGKIQRSRRRMGALFQPVVR
jgi:hypothetical protein